MKTLHLHIMLVTMTTMLLLIILEINSAYATNQIDTYRDRYYSAINVTGLDLIATNSSEFKNITFDIQHTFVDVITMLKHQDNDSYTLGPFDVIYFLHQPNNIVTKTLVMTVNSHSEIIGSVEYVPFIVPPSYPIPAINHLPISENYTLTPDEMEKLKIILPPYPLQQAKSGISANDVECYSSFELIFKSEDKSPACVRYNTGVYLTERGWAINQTHQEWLNLVDDHSGEISIYKNGTTIAKEAIDIHIQNFHVLSPPVVVKIFYQNGTLYKADEISSNSIHANGYYKYNLTISSSHESNVFGQQYNVHMEHNGNIGEILVGVPVPP